jgi:O-antigen/teichoic acid export membrane protein
MKALLTGEIAYAGIAMTGTLLLWYFKIINCPFALLCLATACIIGSAVGLFQSKQQFLLGLSYSKSALKETSKYSKWAVVGVTISIIQSHSYVYLLSAMTSLAVTAEVSASKMFLMPIGILISGIGRIFIPKGSEILNKSGGYNRLLKLILVTIIALVLLSISYCIILYIFFKEIVHITIGNKYLNINQYFLLWASFFTIQVIRYPISSALQVLKKFKYTAIVGAVSATVTITICLLGIRTMSGKEVILGLLCGEIVGILLYLPVLKYKTTDTL